MHVERVEGTPDHELARTDVANDPILTIAHAPAEDDVDARPLPVAGPPHGRIQERIVEHDVACALDPDAKRRVAKVEARILDIELPDFECAVVHEHARFSTLS